MELNSPFTETLQADRPHCHSGASPRAVWGAAFWAAVLILPQMKVN